MNILLGQQFLHVAVRKWKTRIPTHGQENHLPFKFSPLEQTGTEGARSIVPAIATASALDSLFSD